MKKTPKPKLCIILCSLIRRSPFLTSHSSLSPDILTLFSPCHCTTFAHTCAH